MRKSSFESYARRDFLKVSGAAATATLLVPWNALAAPTAQEEAGLNTYRSKAMGCFMGAAIADAMGGPVECQHYRRIAREYPDFQEFLPYRKPPGLISLNPGYALDDEPGNVTDDTYIRMDLAGYLLQNDPPYSAAGFAAWLLEHGDFSNWWKRAVEPLHRIKAGETTAEEAGQGHKQGGGGGWWQPVAMLYAGDPKQASAVAADMCRIWKAPLEQDILSSVVAGQAAAFQAGATVDSVVEAVLADSGPLATQLFTRAVEIARGAKSQTKLYAQLYQHCLVTKCSTNVDGPMPPRVTPKEDHDGFYSGILFAEQQPLALAYFVYGDGDPRKTVLTAVKGGRDADSIATNSASWLGALAGNEVWPRSWRETVQRANLERLDLEQTAADLVAKGIRNGSVRFDG